jgi:hypothetical protein
MKPLFLLFTLMFSISAFATQLTDQQRQIQLVAKEVAENNCLKDICFTETLQAIAWQESSFGRNVIGDAKGSVFFYMHMGKSISIPKSETFIENGTRYTWYQPYKERFIKKVYSKTDWKPLEESSLGAFQIQVPTARFVISNMKLSHYYKYLSDEKALVNALLTDVNFGATIAVNYLNRNYLIGKKRQRRAWFFAVSRYNGGNNNVNYVRKISQKIKKIKSLELSFQKHNMHDLEKLACKGQIGQPVICIKS